MDLRTAQADLEVIRQNLATRYPDTEKAFGIRLLPYLDSAMADYSLTLWLLEGTVACLLLIACANIANLLLARARERRREISIRAALGASRPRLVLQLLLESTVLAAVSGVIGLFLRRLGVSRDQKSGTARYCSFPGDQYRRGHRSLRLGGHIVELLCSQAYSQHWLTRRLNLASALKQEGDRGGTAGR